MIRVHSHASLQGGRKYQEDSYRVGSKSVAVADGLGGHANGAKASTVAVDAAVHSMNQDLSGVMKDAAEAVDELGMYSVGIRDTPGTTLILALWDLEIDTVQLCTIGDSKVYHHRGEETRIVAGFRDSYSNGSMAACLGGGFPLDKVRGHLDTVEMVPGDKVILTTDGCDSYFRFFIDLENGADADHVVKESVRLSGASADNATCVILVCE